MTTATVTLVNGDTIELETRQTVTLDAGELVASLRAVLPHVGDHPVDVVRLAFGPGRQQLSATCRYTAVIDHHESDVIEADEPWSVLVSGADLAVVAKMFKPPKDERWSLRLDLAADGRLSITDCTGLFDGRAFTVPTVAEEHYPDVVDLVTKYLWSGRSVVGAVSYTGDYLRAFAASAAVYGESLVVEPTMPRKPFVVAVGKRLIGLLQPINDDMETVELPLGTWRERL